jgi:hypothetical protein
VQRRRQQEEKGNQRALAHSQSQSFSDRKDLSRVCYRPIAGPGKVVTAVTHAPMASDRQGMSAVTRSCFTEIVL